MYRQGGEVYSKRLQLQRMRFKVIWQQNVRPWFVWLNLEMLLEHSLHPWTLRQSLALSSLSSTSSDSRWHSISHFFFHIGQPPVWLSILTHGSTVYSGQANWLCCSKFFSLTANSPRRACNLPSCSPTGFSFTMNSSLKTCCHLNRLSCNDLQDWVSKLELRNDGCSWNFIVSKIAWWA